MNFIGREEELSKLNREIEKEELSSILIYGRRRVGKSELVKQLIRTSKIKSIYYECRQISEKGNAELFCESVSEALSLPKLGYTDMESALSFVFEWAEKEKIFLVIDEYPYLKSSVNGIDSIIQCLIDHYKDSSKLKLIVLGSYVEMMKTLLEPSNPLFGRISLTLNVKQMDYFDSAKFYPGYSNEDKIRIYTVFGGVPYYNSLIDDSLSVRENIIRLIASPSARLENEISMYLNGEISKIKNANEAFCALSKGYSKYSDLLNQSNVSSSPTLVDVLDKLMRMEVVEKTAPINDENNKKKARYTVSDNLSLFYYRYIFRYSSQMNIMNSERFFDRYISEDFEKQYVPKGFEKICSQYLVRKNRKGEIDPVLEKIGKYYYDLPKEKKNGEFDIVSLDEKGYIFYEVKFRNKPLSSSMVREEINQVKSTGIPCYKYVFFSRSEFEEDVEEAEYISIDSLYKEN